MGDVLAALLDSNGHLFPRHLNTQSDAGRQSSLSGGAREKCGNDGSFVICMLSGSGPGT
jgi:hypothetical protein